MYRLSPTLLDSFDYYLSIEDEEQSQQKRQELIDYLNGKKVVSEAMQKGVDFENNVVLCNMGEKIDCEDERYFDCVHEIAGIVDGSVYQWHIEREFEGVLIHGYADFINRNRVFDVKTTANYEVGKYRNRMQHRIYLACLRQERIDNFTYLITDFRNVYKEDYFWMPEYENELRTSIGLFFEYLSNDVEMKQAYEAKMKKLKMETVK